MLKKFILPLILIFIFSCQTEKHILTLQGETMGTYYRIKIVGAEQQDQEFLISNIQRVLREVNSAASSYMENSLISQFNNSPRGIVIDKTSRASFHFQVIFEKSLDFYKETGGKFDASVGAVTEYLGFNGKDRPEVVDTGDMREIRESIGMFNIAQQELVDSIRFVKNNFATKLDFNAIAKGYAIDEISRALEKISFRDHLIDIGGEVKAKGTKNGNDWIVGINEPNPEASINSVVNSFILRDKAMATSGNYRNFYEVDGQVIHHTIDPHTSLPAENSILSVSVVSSTCAKADAFATACMAMIPEVAMLTLRATTDMEGVVIYVDQKQDTITYLTDGMKELIKDNE